MASPTRIIGKIYRLTKKGFFFVRTEDGKDWFCHRTELEDGLHMDSLTVGMDVEFQPVPDAPKGPRATSITVL